tara:strand:- start:5133 stop:6704 length:1572 start_codon:yes stop_codon:yes gene_type:complete
MVSNEVFVGANAQVGFCPELDLFFPKGDIDNATKTTFTLSSGQQADTLLVADLYAGCMAKVDRDNTDNETEYRMIVSNTTNTVTLDAAVTSSGTNTHNLTIMAFGAPAYAKKTSGGSPLIQSDNWVGLVNTFTPPNVEVEMKQLNLAVAGGRNFDYQYKGAETVSGGSLDLSLNNGSWLYYALGKITNLAVTAGGSGSHSGAAGSQNGIGFTVGSASGRKVVRVIGRNMYPEIFVGSDGSGEDIVDPATVPFNDNGATFSYTIEEADNDVLPSFALDVVYRKAGSRTTSSALDSLTPNENMYSRIFTGCQVNSLALNFEEGQELKSSVELVTRRAFDAPNGYIPLGGNGADLSAPSNTSGGTGMHNYSATLTDNYPFLFSDGSITLFGQSMARIKTGSLTIANNLTPQRFIGNYNRQTMSAHIPGQRTYELSLTMLITDTKLWDEMRSANESTGTLRLKFEKDSGEKIDLQFADYTINSVNVPFPEDKGAVEVEVTASARTLSSCNYTGKWAIYNIGGQATGN